MLGRSTSLLPALAAAVLACGSRELAANGDAADCHRYDPAAAKRAFDGRVGDIVFRNEGDAPVTVRVYHPDGTGAVEEQWVVQPRTVRNLGGGFGSDWGIQADTSCIATLARAAHWDDGRFVLAWRAGALVADTTTTSSPSMRFPFRRSTALPPAARPMARQLFDDFRTLGLVPGRTRDAFESELLAAVDSVLLEELAEQWSEARSPESAEARHVRLQVASRVLGVHADWRFDPADVTAKASARLPGRPRLAATREARGEVAVGPRRAPEFHVTVTLGDGPAVRWRCSALPGFMDAVNAALERAGIRERFVALETDGDYHAFVLADADARARLASSPLLPLSRETDPISGPLPADVR